MPINTDHTDTILRVMADHDVSQAELARLTGLSTSTISRVCSGQYAVTPPITQALWQRTGDARIIQVALGVPNAIVIDADDPQLSTPAVDVATCIIACNHATSSIAESVRISPEPGDHPQTLRTIDTAIRYLINARRRFNGGESVPFAHRQARRLAEPLSA
jgi:hypothetical protein